jgi:hypothetical protein
MRSDDRGCGANGARPVGEPLGEGRPRHRPGARAAAHGRVRRRARGRCPSHVRLPAVCGWSSAGAIRSGRISVPGSRRPRAVSHRGVPRNDSRRGRPLPLHRDGPLRPVRRVARHCQVREWNRRLPSLLVGPADPQRSRRARHAGRDARRLLPPDSADTPVAAGAEADRCGHHRDGTGGGHAVARAEDRVAARERFAPAVPGDPRGRAAISRGARSGNRAADFDARIANATKFSGSDAPSNRGPSW